MKGPVLQFPVAFGAITVSYNLSGSKTGLACRRPTIANIFLGKIKTWNDPAIKALNPGVSLPSTAITVIHRSDSSGTTPASPRSWLTTARRGAQGRAPGKDLSRPDRHRRGEERRRRRRGQADQRRGRLRRAGLCAPERVHFASVEEQGRQVHRADARVDLGGGARHQDPVWTWASARSTRPNPAAYPIVSQTFLIVYKDMCKAGVSPPRGRVEEVSSPAVSAPGQTTVEQAFLRPLRARQGGHRTRSPRSPCNGSRA